MISEVSAAAVTCAIISPECSPESRIRKAGPDTLWKVRDYLEVLTDAEAAHQDLLAIQKKLEDAGSTVQVK